MNEKAVAEYLSIGRVLSTDTFTKGKKHDIKIPKVEPKSQGNVDDVIESLSNAIYNKTKNCKRIAISLSGGKDSRLIVAICQKLCLSADCITWTGGDNDREVLAAKKVANTAHYDHKIIKLDREKFLDDGFAEKSIKITDGNPTYFTLVPYYTMGDALDYDIIIDGNMMTEFMDTGEYRWYEGLDVANALLSKEKDMRIVTDQYYNESIDALLDLYKKDLSQVIVERKIDRIISAHFRYKYFKLWSPMTDNDVINSTFSLPFRERFGSKLVRNMIKQLSPELYSISTSRSPLSLRYPLWVHQAYQKVFKTTCGFDFWKDVLFTEPIESFTEINLGMLNKEKIKQIVSNRDTDSKIARLRLMNVKKWMSVN